MTLDIVKKVAGQKTFAILPRRWVVERAFSWIAQARRKVRDNERLPGHFTMMPRLLTRAGHAAVGLTRNVGLMKAPSADRTW
ncbi:Transposase DDE domain-containing protein [Amycolatopsis xylanica]|uniref:Transposase DDE domain-containing protein n=1 Tax=Amycolatopsis xylanica TaxID=589385 RepID=A0A1H2S3J1_9PSEU|nr:Transposase DDE domain-containing protein [Amycolatopsis xylanica]